MFEIASLESHGGLKKMSRIFVEIISIWEEVQRSRSIDRAGREGCRHHIGSLEIQAGPLFWGERVNGEGQA